MAVLEAHHYRLPVRRYVIDLFEKRVKRLVVLDEGDDDDDDDNDDENESEGEHEESEAGHQHRHHHHQHHQHHHQHHHYQQTPGPNSPVYDTRQAAAAPTGSY